MYLVRRHYSKDTFFIQIFMLYAFKVLAIKLLTSAFALVNGNPVITFLLYSVFQ
jgi:hypothetical protein